MGIVDQLLPVVDCLLLLLHSHVDCPLHLTLLLLNVVGLPVTQRLLVTVIGSILRLVGAWPACLPLLHRYAVAHHTTAPSPSVAWTRLILPRDCWRYRYSCYSSWFDAVRGTVNAPPSHVASNTLTVAAFAPCGLCWDVARIAAVKQRFDLLRAYCG